MKNQLTRIASLLLVLCVAVDPALMAALSQHPSTAGCSAVFRNVHPIFNEEAFELVLVAERGRPLAQKRLSQGIQRIAGVLRMGVPRGRVWTMGVIGWVISVGAVRAEAATEIWQFENPFTPYLLWSLGILGFIIAVVALTVWLWKDIRADRQRDRQPLPEPAPATDVEAEIEFYPMPHSDNLRDVTPGYDRVTRVKVRFTSNPKAEPKHPLLGIHRKGWLEITVRGLLTTRRLMKAIRFGYDRYYLPDRYALRLIGAADLLDLDQPLLAEHLARGIEIISESDFKKELERSA